MAETTPILKDSSSTVDFEKKNVSPKSNRKYKMNKAMQQRQKAVIKHDCSTISRRPTLQVSKTALAQRQRTMTLLSYNRKSLSQVDFKEVLRSGSSPRVKGDNAAKVIINNEESIIVSKNPFVAGMRVYATILLNAWRKRGDVIKDLAAQVERFKQNSLNSKNQLHVFRTLFSDEKERTKELTEELKTAKEHISLLQQSEAELKSQLANIEKKRLNAEQQLLIKTQDHHAVNVYFKQTKNELYKLMSEHQELQVQVQLQQQKVADLEAERLKLLRSIELISKDARHVEENLHNTLELKSNELTVMSLKAQSLKLELQKLKSKHDLECNKFSSDEMKLRKEVETLQTETEVLRHCLAGTIGQRMRDCWNASVMLQRTSFGFVHWFACTILPALPPPLEGAPGIPSIGNPFGFFTIEKAMNLIKR